MAMRRLMLAVLAAPAVVMALVAVAALGAGIAQTGGVTVHASAIAFKPERINPVANLKNLFSLRAAARLGKSLIPASFLAVFAVAAHRPATDAFRRFRPSGWNCWARMFTDCCWPRRGCSSAGRRSTTWWSGRAASRA